MSKKPEKVLLVAIARAAGAMKISSGAALFVSTYTAKAGKKVYVILCGFSTEASRDNAFDSRFVDDVITQWTSVNGRGWKFEVRDTKGNNPRPVAQGKKR